MMHGATLAEVGIKSGDAIIAERIPVREKLAMVPFFLEESKIFTDEMERICQYVFSLNKNAYDIMEKEQVVAYMTKATK